MSGNVHLGQVGSFQQLQITHVIDDKTATAKWVEMSRMTSSLQEIVISPMDAKSVKVGQSAFQNEVFVVRAVNAEQSELLIDERIRLLNSQPLFVVEPIKKNDVDRYRREYDQQKRQGR